MEDLATYKKSKIPKKQRKGSPMSMIYFFSFWYKLMILASNTNLIFVNILYVHPYMGNRKVIANKCF